MTTFAFGYFYFIYFFISEMRFLKKAHRWVSFSLTTLCVDDVFQTFYTTGVFGCHLVKQLQLDQTLVYGSFQ